MNNQLLLDFEGYIRSERQYAEHTVQAYTRDIKLFFQYCLHRLDKAPSDQKISAINIEGITIEVLGLVTVDDLNAFFDYQLNKGLKQTTCLRMVTSIKQFYLYLCQVRQEPLENISLNIRPLPKAQLTMRPLSTEQINLLLNGVCDPNGLRDMAILTLFIHTGLRLRELCAIKLDDAIKEDITVYGRGGIERIVSFNEPCRNAIDAYLAIRPMDAHTPYLFLNSWKRRISGRTVETIVKKRAEDVGLNNVNVNTLRQTATRLMIESDETDLQTVQKKLGHKYSVTTEQYLKWFNMVDK